jgi:hypothetical protein
MEKQMMKQESGMMKSENAQLKNTALPRIGLSYLKVQPQYISPNTDWI